MSGPEVYLSSSELSQPVISQDDYVTKIFHSQLDGLLSQDSTYQGGR